MSSNTPTAVPTDATDAADGSDAAPAIVDVAAEFDRQVRTLLDLDYPGLTEQSTAEFTASLEPLRQLATERLGSTVDAPALGRAPFLIVVTRAVVPIEAAMTLTTLAGRIKPGFVDRLFEPGALPGFVPPPGMSLPDAPAYLVYDVDRGEEFRSVVPDTALAEIADRGRVPLTIEEGIAFVTQHPAVLATNLCFSLGGSRSGDRRVPAIWISQRAPKLGWCWAGNPHTWLGVASAADRNG